MLGQDDGLLRGAARGGGRGRGCDRRGELLVRAARSRARGGTRAAPRRRRRVRARRGARAARERSSAAWPLRPATGATARTRSPSTTSSPASTASLDGVRIADRRELRSAQVAAQRDGEQQPPHRVGKRGDPRARAGPRRRRAPASPRRSPAARARRACARARARTADCRASPRRSGAGGGGERSARAARAAVARSPSRPSGPTCEPFRLAALQHPLEVGRRARGAWRGGSSPARRRDGARRTPAPPPTTESSHWRSSTATSEGPVGRERPQHVEEPERDRTRLGRSAGRRGAEQRHVERGRCGAGSAAKAPLADVLEQVGQPGEGELRLGAARTRRQDPQPALPRRVDRRPPRASSCRFPARPRARGRPHDSRSPPRTARSRPARRSVRSPSEYRPPARTEKARRGNPRFGRRGTGPVETHQRPHWGVEACSMHHSHGDVWSSSRSRR